MKKLMIFSLALFLAGCGSEKNTPVVNQDTGPVISNLTMTAGTSNVGFGYGWGCSGCFLPDYGCTQTTSLTFTFDLTDPSRNLQNLSIFWTDSLGLLSSSRINPNGIFYSPNQKISFVIPHTYQDPGLLEDAGSGQANCTDSARTYTYTLFMKNIVTGKQSNSLSTTWTITN